MLIAEHFGLTKKKEEEKKGTLQQAIISPEQRETVMSGLIALERQTPSPAAPISPD